MNYRRGRPPVGWANTFLLEEEYWWYNDLSGFNCNKIGIEILEVGIEKFKLNTKEYPASQVRGIYIDYD